VSRSRDKLEVGPEFPTSNRPKTSTPHAATNAGSKRRRENGQPCLRLTNRKRGRHAARKQRHPRFSVMHRRRGGEARKRGTVHRGVTPESCRYPSSAAGFRRRALFFEAPTIAKSERHRLLRSSRVRPLESRSDSGPYVSGTMGTGDRNNHAYGISCRTRPIPIVRTRSDIPRNRYRMGHLTHRSLQLGRDKRHELIDKKRCDRRRARPEKWPDLGPVDYKPGLLPNCEATNLIRPSQLTGSTPQEVGLPRRFTSRLRRSHRGPILGMAQMLSIRIFGSTPNFLAHAWHALVRNYAGKRTCEVSHINEIPGRLCGGVVDSQHDSDAGVR
jgi:hypothetical protein